MNEKLPGDDSIETSLGSIGNLPRLLEELEKPVPTYHHTNYDPKNQAGTIYVKIDGGSQEPGGFTIIIPENGENSVKFHHGYQN